MSVCVVVNLFFARSFRFAAVFVMMGGSNLSSLAAAGPEAAADGLEKPDEEYDSSGSIPWRAKDTQLANHYLQLLQYNPEFGRVVDLLWDLYESHNATALLVEHFEIQAEHNVLARLIVGHLHWKLGDVEAALDVYDDVLATQPTNRFALDAKAKLAIQNADFSTAIETLSRLIDQVEDYGSAAAGHRLRLGDLHLHK